MTTSARIPIRLHPALAVLLIAFCLATIVFLISWAVPFRLAGQAYLMVIILFAFRYWPPMIRLVISMPVAHRIVFGVLIACMIAGHYSLNGRSYFPFVNWAIFPNYTYSDPVTCDEFIATTMSGKKVRLLAEQLFPSIVQTARIEALDDPAWFPPGTTEHLARALAKVYNEQHPDNPVWRVDLMRLAVQLHPPPSESRAHPSCELLKRYDISSGQ